jgi:hypothetical protein
MPPFSLKKNPLILELPTCVIPKKASEKSGALGYYLGNASFIRVSLQVDGYLKQSQNTPR